MATLAILQIQKFEGSYNTDWDNDDAKDANIL